VSLTSNLSLLKDNYKLKQKQPLQNEEISVKVLHCKIEYFQPSFHFFITALEFEKMDLNFNPLLPSFRRLQICSHRYMREAFYHQPGNLMSRYDYVLNPCSLHSLTPLLIVHRTAAQVLYFPTPNSFFFSMQINLQLVGARFKIKTIIKA
jgi:hypothetical protein